MWKSFFLAFPKDCGKLEEFSKLLWESRRDFHNSANPGISTKLGAVDMWKMHSLLHLLAFLTFLVLGLNHPVALQVHLDDYGMVH